MNEERREKMQGVAGAAMAEQPGPLFNEGEVMDLRSRWDAVQTSFVDQPRESVEQADQLVSAAVKRLSEMFTAERDKLEQQWRSGQDVSTEDLRVALQRYRSFFTRILSV